MRSSVRHTKLFPFFFLLCLLSGVCGVFFNLFTMLGIVCVCVYFWKQNKEDEVKGYKVMESIKNRLRTYIYRHGGLKMFKHTFSKQQATKLWCFNSSQNDQWCPLGQSRGCVVLAIFCYLCLFCYHFHWICSVCTCPTKKATTNITTMSPSHPAAVLLMNIRATLLINSWIQFIWKCLSSGLHFHSAHFSRKWMKIDSI